MASEKFYGTGRRKSSVARVYLTQGTGKITINKRDIDDFFGMETLKVVVRQPLTAIDGNGKYDLIVTVHGGGYTGQAGAIRHGLARALVKMDPELRPTLKKAGYLTRVQQAIIHERTIEHSKPLKALCFQGFFLF